MTDGLIVDLFAGGGGASVGIEAALRRPVDIAINHDPVALAVHKANHPRTKHLTADIWEVKPLQATRGRPVSVLWASPDCTHFSVAKGDVPKSKKIRSLAWAVVRWAKEVHPSVILLENVTEFKGWGPLGDDGKPLKAKMGQTFKAWRRRLIRLGYEVDYRILDASEFGAPTKRRRLFLVARCDGQPIRWPQPTHGKLNGAPDLFGEKQPVRTAAQCIDWSIPCPSIFERKKALAEKTLWRIAEGIRRFVFEDPQPFIIEVAHGKREPRGTALNQPMPTVTASRRSQALVTPYIMGVGGRASQSHATGGLDPVGTITAKNDRVVITPFLSAAGGPEFAGQPRSAHDPMGTVMPESNRTLIAPTLIQTGYGEDKNRNGGKGQKARVPGLDKPLGTVVAGGAKHALVSAFITKHFGDRGQRPGSMLPEPVSTITPHDHNSLTTAHIVKLRGDNVGSSMKDPAPTIAAQGFHIGEVRAFLTAYYSSDRTKGKGQSLRKPMRAATAKMRLGLVTVEGIDYQIVDIGMRMLEPHELLRAQFGKFAETYDLSAAPTKSGKVRLIGNSVCPEVAEALVRANVKLSPARRARRVA